MWKPTSIRPPARALPRPLATSSTGSVRETIRDKSEFSKQRKGHPVRMALWFAQSLAAGMDPESHVELFTTIKSAQGLGVAAGAVVFRVDLVVYISLVKREPIPAIGFRTVTGNLHRRCVLQKPHSLSNPLAFTPTPTSHTQTLPCSRP